MDFTGFLANYLEEKGLGSRTKGAHLWRIVRSQLSSDVSQPQIAVLSGPGSPPGMSHSGVSFRQPAVQIMIQDHPDTYLRAVEKAEQVFNALAGKVLSQNKRRFLLTPASDVLWLGYSGPDGAPRFSLNFDILT